MQRYIQLQGIERRFDILSENQLQLLMIMLTILQKYKQHYKLARISLFHKNIAFFNLIKQVVL